MMPIVAQRQAMLFPEGIDHPHRPARRAVIRYPAGILHQTHTRADHHIEAHTAPDVDRWVVSMVAVVPIQQNNIARQSLQRFRERPEHIIPHHHALAMCGDDLVQTQDMAAENITLRPAGVLFAAARAESEIGGFVRVDADIGRARCWPRVRRRSLRAPARFPGGRAELIPVAAFLREMPVLRMVRIPDNDRVRSWQGTISMSYCAAPPAGRAAPPASRSRPGRRRGVGYSAGDFRNTSASYSSPAHAARAVCAPSRRAYRSSTPGWYRT